ncbi:MAG: hypothetical protein LBD45_08820 [Bacteroidales bacterium]|jgi:hypothetical protein|nr:hypothetical protein [Bacteroidales bacterium]
MEKVSIITGEATPEQVETWKKKHGRVFQVKTGESVGYLKKPGRSELSYAGKVGAQKPLDFSEAIFQSCWLGGDETIKSNDEKFLAVSSQLENVISVAEAEIKEL